MPRPKRSSRKPWRSYTTNRTSRYSRNTSRRTGSTCKHKWAQFQGKGIPTFVTRTTNYLESFHQKLKRLVTKNTTINDLVCVLHTMSEEKSRQKKKTEMVNLLKVAYNLRHDNEVTRNLYQFSFKYSAKKAMDQYELALSRGEKWR